MICPHCGKRTDKPFTVDPFTHMLTIDSHAVQLTRNESEIAYAMLNIYPNTARCSYIIACVFDQRQNMTIDSNLIDSNVRSMIKKLDHTRIKIIHVFGGGYYFELSDAVTGA